MKKLTVILGILLLGISIYIFWPDEEKIFQTAPLLVLVFVTLYYAIETHLIVKESETKRIADFYERRINEFYSPFIVQLNELNAELHNDKNEKTIHEEKMNSMQKKFQEFLWTKDYMIPLKTMEKIKTLKLNLDMAEISRDKGNFRDFYRSEREARIIINTEWRDIAEKIRVIYGYHTKEANNKKAGKEKEDQATNNQGKGG